MYSEYFKLNGKPFQLSPNPRFFFGSRGHQKAMAYLQYGLHQGEGFIVITGEVGTGKTTLIGHLLDQLDATKYVTAKLVTTQLDADDMLRMVAAAFGMDPAVRDKATLLMKFERFLLENQRKGQRTLVLVDEVQNLPMRSLEELRMLSNFQASDVAPVQFFLVGQPQFRQMMAGEELMQLRQRVIASYHLGPLSLDETHDYIEHRLHLVNWQSDPVIAAAAYRRVHECTGGVPRQINLLCDRLFVGAMLEELHEISLGLVDTVASEMLAENTRVSADGEMREPLPAPAAATAPRVDDPTVSDLARRLASVEKLVQSHDKTIQRAIELIANYLESRSASAPKEMPPRKAGSATTT
jgi:putative secretion ATPase (PEP-CTERM system associated)